MIDMFQALVVALVALLPGATSTFAYERVFGAYGVSFSDRLVRLFTTSAAYQAVLAGPLYAAYDHYVRSGRFGRGDVSWIRLELAAIAYVFVPAGIGYLAGRAQAQGWRWARRLLASSPEPRAWDYLWRTRRAGVVRLRLTSGTWLAGEWKDRGSKELRSYAAGYPEDRDLLLVRRYEVDAETGEFAVAGGRPIIQENSNLLVGWDRIEYVELLEASDV